MTAHTTRARSGQHDDNVRSTPWHLLFLMAVEGEGKSNISNYGTLPSLFSSGFLHDGYRSFGLIMEWKQKQGRPGRHPAPVQYKLLIPLRHLTSLQEVNLPLRLLCIQKRLPLIQSPETCLLLRLPCSLSLCSLPGRLVSKHLLCQL